MVSKIGIPRKSSRKGFFSSLLGPSGPTAQRFSSTSFISGWLRSRAKDQTARQPLRGFLAPRRDTSSHERKVGAPATSPARRPSGRFRARRQLPSKLAPGGQSTQHAATRRNTHRE